MTIKKKILCILHLPPPVHGASVMGQQIMESKLINDRAFDMRYINLSTSRQIDEIGHWHWAKIGRFLSIWWKILTQLLFSRPDLCYITLTAKGKGFYKDTLVVLLVRLLGVSRVYHLHNKGVRCRQEYFPDRLLYRFVFQGAAVILLSPHLYPDIAHFVPRRNVFYCPNGLPNDFNDNIERPNLHQHHVPELLFLSNMIASKGVFVVLEACHQLKNEGIPFHCSFIGGWGDIVQEQFDRCLADLDLRDEVTYAGKKFGEEKLAYLDRTDIFVLPTFYENECLPLVVLEAMSHHKPVVSTFEGGIPDAVVEGSTGYLCPQKDVAALAERIGYLIKHPDIARQMGEEGHQRFLSHYTLAIFEKTFVKILRQILRDPYRKWPSPEIHPDEVNQN